MSTQDRDFWRAHNRRKHAYWMNHKQEQREAAKDEALRPEPETKPLTRVLPVVR